MAKLLQNAFAQVCVHTCKHRSDHIHVSSNSKSAHSRESVLQHAYANISTCMLRIFPTMDSVASRTVNSVFQASSTLERDLFHARLALLRKHASNWGHDCPSTRIRPLARLREIYSMLASPSCATRLQLGSRLSIYTNQASSAPF